METAGRLVEGLVSFFMILVEGFLGLRFLFRLLSANPDNAFVGWIYDMSAELLAPFRGIFPPAVIEDRFVVEFSTLFAMLAYALLAYLVYALISAVTPTGGAKTAKKRK